MLALTQKAIVIMIIIIIIKFITINRATAYIATDMSVVVTYHEKFYQVSWHVSKEHACLYTSEPYTWKSA